MESNLFVIIQTSLGPSRLLFGQPLDPSMLLPLARMHEGVS